MITWLAKWRQSSTSGSLRWLFPATALSLLFLVGIGVFDMANFLGESDEYSLARERNFFGTLSVYRTGADDDPGRYHSLKHGSITHGLQPIDPERRHFPTTYYGQESGVGRAIGFYRRSGDQIGGMRVGAVGLGVGTLAAYIDTGDAIRFYEINPIVKEITESGRWFTYLTECSGKYEIVMGDARLSLERELKQGLPQRYHVIVLDAFSGDAIPVHLLTKEAFETYLGHLATPDAGGAHGAIAVHISNRYVELEPIVRGLAEHFGLDSFLISNSDNKEKAVYSSDWMILTRNPELIEELKPIAESPTKLESVLWTDAFNNLFDALK
jgi:hypothetical protein